MPKTFAINSRTWRISEVAGNGHAVGAYLLAGEKRAVLVDSLDRENGLYEAVRELTRLPADVVHTHGHGDHTGASLPDFAAAGCGIWMDKRDTPLLKRNPPERFTGVVFKELRDGQLFDLGDRELEIISVPGHTAGSLVVFDRGARHLFTGDTVGSGGFWMQLPESLPLAEFAGNLRRLSDDTKTPENLLVFPGHARQSPFQLTGEYIGDVLSLTEDIVSGVVDGMPDTMTFGEGTIQFKRASRGLMRDYCYVMR